MLSSCLQCVPYIKIVSIFNSKYVYRWIGASEFLSIIIGARGFVSIGESGFFSIGVMKPLKIVLWYIILKIIFVAKKTTVSDLVLVYSGMYFPNYSMGFFSFACTCTK